MSAVSANIGAEKCVLDSEDLDFAQVELIRLTEWPWLEIHITARQRVIENSRVSQLLVFIGRVLESDEASNGFGITYDLRLLTNPSVKVLLTIAKWGAVPERQALFLQRCIACKACVPPGWKFAATKAAMGAFFCVTPPTCKTYLVTDFDANCEQRVCFDPPASAPQSSAKAQSSLVVDSPSTETALEASDAASSRTASMRQLDCGRCFTFLRSRPSRPKKIEMIATPAIEESTDELEYVSPENRGIVRMLVQLVGQLELRGNMPWTSAVYHLFAFCYLAYCVKICGGWHGF